MGRYSKPKGQTFTLTGTPIRDVVQIGRRGWDKKAYTRIDPHRHDATRLELLYVERGQRTQKVNGKSYTLLSGHVLLILPGEVHAAGDLPEERSERTFLILRVPHGRGSFLNLRGAAADCLRQALLHPRHRHFVLSTLGAHLLKTLLQCLPIEKKEDLTNPLAIVRIEALVAAFVLESLRCSELGMKEESSSWATDVKGYIDANLSAPLRIKDLADRVGMSVIGFHCRFKKEFNVPPTQYIARARIDAAKGLLQRPDATVTDTALALGFSSSQHFSAFFRRHVGITPREHRNRFRPESDEPRGERKR